VLTPVLDPRASALPDHRSRLCARLVLLGRCSASKTAQPPPIIAMSAPERHFDRQRRQEMGNDRAAGKAQKHGLGNWILIR